MTSAASTLLVAEPPAQYLVKPPLVVDASVLNALLFNEPERDAAAQQLEGRHLLAPRLLDYEVASVALKKHKRGLPASDIELALSLYEGLALERCDIPVPEVYELATRTGLTTYDAAYLWLANYLKAPLITLDAQLAAAARTYLQDTR